VTAQFFFVSAQRIVVLSDRQAAVLAWVRDGCVEGVWPDQTHKSTAAALKNRGLITVSRRGGRWSAQLTEQGRAALDTGTFTQRRADAPIAPAAGTSSAVATARLEILDLLERLSAEPVLHVVSPSMEVRAAYRRAMSRAITSGQVPAGHVLRHSGRDSGDMIIRLVPTPPETETHPPLAPVPIPEQLEQPHPVVRALLEATPVGGSVHTQQRAMRVLHGVAVEAERRGWQFSDHVGVDGGFRIEVGPDAFDFLLVEETEQVTVIPDEDLAAAKYDWQRLPTSTETVASGRLALELHERYRYRPLRWADRKRWTLDQKLPEVFRHIEEAARAAAEARDHVRADAEARRRTWEEAVDAARGRFIVALNRERIAEQVRARRQAIDMRDYAAELTDLAGSTEGAERRAAILGWAELVSAEADRLDPLLAEDGLRPIEPDTIPPSKLDPFMPAGMLASQPPPDPDSD
jgi:hypothetical protein